MKHKTKLTIGAWYPGDIEVLPRDLAELLGDLRYDGLADYLSALAEKLQRDSESDGGRGRGMLSRRLENAASGLRLAVDAVEDAWDICKDYMESEK